MFQLFQFLKLVGTFAIQTCIFIIVSILSLILLVLLIPLYLWKLLVIFIIFIDSRNARDNSIEPVSGHAAIFAVGSDNNKTNPNSIIATISIVEGAVDLASWTQKFKEEIIDAKRPDGSHVYDRLQQYRKRILGFYFWHWDMGFKITDHIRQIDDVNINEDNMSKFIERYSSIPFDNGNECFPPWEILIFHRYNDSDQTVILFRFDHAVGDGFSMMKLVFFGIMKLAKPPGIDINKNENPTYRKISGFAKLGNILNFPYRYLGEMLSLNDSNYLCNKRMKAKGERIVTWSQILSLDEIKQTKLQLKIPFTAIIASAISLGIKDYLKRYNEAGVLPQNMKFYFPFPVPGHPHDRLVNQWSVGISEVPIGRAEFGNELFGMVKNNFVKSRNSSFGFASYYALKLIGSLPTWLISKVAQFPPLTFQLSNIPGAGIPIHYFGYNVIDMMFWLPLVGNSAGFNFSLLSCVDTFRIGMVADKGYIPSKEHLDYLSKCVTQNLHKIYQFAADLEAQKAGGVQTEEVLEKIPESNTTPVKRVITSPV